jgi:hypothetical protein
MASTEQPIEVGATPSGHDVQSNIERGRDPTERIERGRPEMPSFDL